MRCVSQTKLICRRIGWLVLALVLYVGIWTPQPSGAQQQVPTYQIVEASVDSGQPEAQPTNEGNKEQVSNSQPAQPSTPRRARKRIAVVGFEVPQDVYQSWVVRGKDQEQQYTVQVQTAASRIGNVITDMLITALVEKGNFIVVERAELDRVMKEQQLGEERRDDTALAKAGKILKVDYIIGGKLTEFGAKEQRTAGVLGGILQGIAGINVRKSTARAVVDARLIEVATGRTLKSYKGEAENNQQNLAFGGAGGKGFLDFIGGVSLDSSEWTESRIGKAARAAIEQIITKLSEDFPLEATVLSILPDGSLIIDAGKYSNVAAGSELEIFRETEEKDDEGTVIWRESKKVGEARVVEVQEDRAKCTLTGSVTEKPQKGDIIRLKKPQLDKSEGKKKK